MRLRPKNTNKNVVVINEHMPQDVDFDKYGSEYFEKTINTVAEHPDWSLSDPEESVAEISKEASDFHGNEELMFDHEDTEGYLRLQVPNTYSPVTAVGGTLSQPLDGTQRTDPYEGSFGETVQEAYQSVVDEHENEYLTMDSDPVSVLSVSVPLDYDQGTFREALTVASDVSQEIQNLNDEVMAVLEERI